MMTGLKGSRSIGISASNFGRTCDSIWRQWRRIKLLKVGGDAPRVLVVRAVGPEGRDSIGRPLFVRGNAAMIQSK